jgi:hypothetical protein
MQLKMFVAPIKNLGAAEAEMNGFLRGHRVLAVKKEFVPDGENSTSEAYFAKAPGFSFQRSQAFQSQQ